MVVGVVTAVVGHPQPASSDEAIFEPVVQPIALRHVRSFQAMVGHLDDGCLFYNRNGDGHVVT